MSAVTRCESFEKLFPEFSNQGRDPFTGKTWGELREESLKMNHPVYMMALIPRSSTIAQKLASSLQEGEVKQAVGQSSFILCNASSLQERIRELTASESSASNIVDTIKYFAIYAFQKDFSLRTIEFFSEEMQAPDAKSEEMQAPDAKSELALSACTLQKRIEGWHLALIVAYKIFKEAEELYAKREFEQTQVLCSHANQWILYSDSFPSKIIPEDEKTTAGNLKTSLQSLCQQVLQRITERITARGRSIFNRKLPEFTGTPIEGLSRPSPHRPAAAVSTLKDLEIKFSNQ